MARILTYEEKDTWIHRLSGITKLTFFLLWSVVGMLTYDTRVLLFMLVSSLVIFKVSKTDWHQVGTVFVFILLFLCLNLFAIFCLAPMEGVKIYGTRTELFRITEFYVLTKEQLFYEFNVMLKYFSVIPVVTINISTTGITEKYLSITLNS